MELVPPLVGAENLMLFSKKKKNIMKRLMVFDLKQFFHLKIFVSTALIIVDC